MIFQHLKNIFFTFIISNACVVVLLFNITIFKKINKIVSNDTSPRPPRDPHMHTFIHSHMYTHSHTFTLTHVHTLTHSHPHTHLHTYTHSVYTLTHVHTRLQEQTEHSHTARHHGIKDSWPLGYRNQDLLFCHCFLL